MSIQLIATCSVLYMCLLFAVAYWCERRAEAGRSFVSKPYIYALSLAVYCTAWTFYGSVGRAATGGMSYLAVYLGPTLAAPLWYFLLYKMIAISKSQKITSIADFISSRYGKSSALGVLVTIVAVAGIVPYISIQLKAITFSFDILTSGRTANSDGVFYHDIAFYIALVLGLFTIVFGTRKLEPNERHEGLVAAIAFESVIKLAAFTAVGLFVTFGLFDGFGDLFRRAAEQPEIAKVFTLQGAGIETTQWATTLVLSMFAILLLPRQFHIAVVENMDPRYVRTTMWLFPLYLLLINIFVLPIAIAGLMHFGGNGLVDADTFVLNLPLANGKRFLALLAFLGGFSAATSMVIVETTALSIMLSNHVVVPFLLRTKTIGNPEEGNLTQHLLDTRRVSILVVLLLAYLYLATVGSKFSLVSVGMISFTAVAQFAPSVIGALYWKRGTRQGAISGLVAGFAIWVYCLSFPSFVEAGYIDSKVLTEGLLGWAFLRPYALFGLEHFDHISHAAFWSLFFNTLIFIAISLRTKPNALELSQADLFVDFSKYGDSPDFGYLKREASVYELRALLQRFLGDQRAEQIFAEFEKTHGGFMDEMAIAGAELVNFVETNLAGAVGASSAKIIVEGIVKEDPISLEEMMRVLEETKEVMQYSKALEEKSRELETTTEQLRLANEQLKEIDQLKADFITTVTHELRTPVTSIKALSKIILDYKDIAEEKKEEYLRILVSESDRIGRLINQVLDIEKLNADMVSWRMEPVGLGGLIDLTVKGLEQNFLEKNIECRFSKPLEEVVVEGDKDRLIQVVINLLTNAIKFCPTDGTGLIEVDLDKRDGQAAICVRDNGIGILPAEQSLIFERFTQLQNHPSGKPKGSGLGLYISKKIMDRHGGRITVESQRDEGAAFTMWLPFRRPNFQNAFSAEL